MAYIRYFGHSSFEIVLGGVVMFLDPYFTTSGRKFPSARKDAHDIKKCDLILITHEHFDHFEPETVVEIAERTWATVVAPRPVLRELKLPERQKMEVKAGDKFQVKGVEIEVMQAVHPQSACPVGYIIEKDGVRVYAAGDTYEFSGMMDIKCDWALLPIGGVYTMDVISAEKAAKEIKCKHAVPTHYATFDRIAVDAKEFARGLEGSKVRPVVMKFGEQVQL
jgi:L-ascorbate metabolism protein UlaG (beta-lactamase superfamily)